MKRKNLSVTISVSAIAVILGLVLAMHFMHLSAYVITGKSMTGAISKGSLAIDRDVPVTSLQVGDIITFRPPESMENVTHRIIAVTHDDTGRPVFQTKGDYNEAVDPWQFTLDREVQAKYEFSIPYAGYALAVFTLRWVRTGILAVIGLLLVAATVAHAVKSHKDSIRPADSGRANLGQPGEAR